MSVLSEVFFSSNILLESPSLSCRTGTKMLIYSSAFFSMHVCNIPPVHIWVFEIIIDKIFSIFQGFPHIISIENSSHDISIELLDWVRSLMKTAIINSSYVCISSSNVPTWPESLDAADALHHWATLRKVKDQLIFVPLIFFFEPLSLPFAPPPLPGADNSKPVLTVVTDRGISELDVFGNENKSIICFKANYTGPIKGDEIGGGIWWFFGRLQLRWFSFPRDSLSLMILLPSRRFGLGWKTRIFGAGLPRARVFCLLRWITSGHLGGQESQHACLWLARSATFLGQW